jgi:hypothetical protein
MAALTVISVSSVIFISLRLYTLARAESKGSGMFLLRIKDKVVPLRSIEAHLGDRRCSSYSFLTSAFLLCNVLNTVGLSTWSDAFSQSRNRKCVSILNSLLSLASVLS